MRFNLVFKGLIFLSFILLSFSCAKETTDKEYQRNGNNVVVRVPSDVRTLNPTFAFDAYSLLVLRTINQYLANYDLETQKIVPVLLKDLATISESEGVMNYTMEIREEATWDDGKPITAHDVATSLKLLFNPKAKPSPYRPYLDFIDSFEIDPANNKKFTIRSSQKYILAEEAIYMIMPIHQASIYDADGLLDKLLISDLINGDFDASLESDLALLAEEYNSEKFSSDPAFVNGSGPYKMTEWKAGELVTMVKKGNWWGEGLQGINSWFKAYPDTISLKPVTDATTAVQMFSNNEFDVVISLDSKDFVKFSKNERLIEEYRFEAEPTNTVFLVYQNMKSPILSDKKVRQAVSKLFDYENIIANIFDGLGARINSPVGASKPYYDSTSEMISYNAEEALALLNEAGWDDSNSDGILDKELNGVRTDLSLSYVVSSTAASENIALYFQQAANDIGMDVEIIKKDRKGWYEIVQQRAFDLTMNGAGFSPGLDDFKQMFHTESNTPSGQNRMQFGNSETDELLDAITKNFDESSRTKQYIEFQKILADELPLVWLMAPLSRVVIHDRFDGGSSGLSPNICLGCMKMK
ncbi:MAG: ABC transporter substrate-binding protein [Saprospiraceae bacterium]|nr:ABC transporter substrate-binding protein [Saprospiraceae bacterium]